ncbi:MAG: hypothetical protein EBV05_01875 [Cyanobacteria bacterium WB6_1B_304]|nr:hypothetical protein [Cyanobacteria bacterium WB6_1B_304]
MGHRVTSHPKQLDLTKINSCLSNSNRSLPQGGTSEPSPQPSLLRGVGTVTPNNYLVFQKRVRNERLGNLQKMD